MPSNPPNTSSYPKRNSSLRAQLEKVGLLLSTLAIFNPIANNSEAQVEESREHISQALSSDIGTIKIDKDLTCEEEFVPEKSENGGICMDGTLDETRERPHAILIENQFVSVREIEPYERPHKLNARLLRFPISDEAKSIVNNQDKDEKLVVFYEGKSSTGMPFRTRESLAKAFELANSYAATEGYCLVPSSSYRTEKNQRQLYQKTSKNRRGKWVGSTNGSLHRRGAALDIQLCELDESGEPKKDEKGKIISLVSRNKKETASYEDHFLKLHKYMCLAGFANYKRESWHWEIGSKQALGLLKRAGYINRRKNSAYGLLEIK